MLFVTILRLMPISPDVVLTIDDQMEDTIYCGFGFQRCCCCLCCFPSKSLSNEACHIQTRTDLGKKKKEKKNHPDQRRATLYPNGQKFLQPLVNIVACRPTCRPRTSNGSSCLVPVNEQFYIHRGIYYRLHKMM